MKPEFTETQKFRQWWFWLIIAPIIIFVIVFIVKQLVMGEPVGSKPLSNLQSYFFIGLVVVFIWMLLSLQLKTLVDSKGVSMKYKPFLNRKYTWDEIEKWEVIDYGFVGYGFRLSFKHGWVYNVGGTMGLKLHLKSGKQLTIGTQNPDELENTLTLLNN